MWPQSLCFVVRSLTDCRADEDMSTLCETQSSVDSVTAGCRAPDVILKIDK